MFLIHPSDLEQRRKRCARVVESLLSSPRELAPACGICASTRSVVVSERDRYGLPVRTAMCLNCGLFYLLDRFTARAYAEFYRNGSYRLLTSLFNGVHHSISRIQADQIGYARRLAGLLEGYATWRKGARLLDIGGSAGLIAREFATRFGINGTVLDPAEEEIAAARAKGLDGVVGTIEDWTTPERFDLILLCRSVEHLFDLETALRKIRALLRPGGLFFFDIAEFFELCNLTGPPQTVTKVDHCYWLSQESVPGICRGAGLELLSMSITFGQGQVGFVFRACEPMPVPPLQQIRLDSQIRRLQQIDAAWLEYGQSSVDSIDWLRRKAYRVKRRIQKLSATGNGRPVRSAVTQHSTES